MTRAFAKLTVIGLAVHLVTGDATLFLVAGCATVVAGCVHFLRLAFRAGPPSGHLPH
jgi:hypothetical protein